MDHNKPSTSATMKESMKATKSDCEDQPINETMSALNITCGYVNGDSDCEVPTLSSDKSGNRNRRHPRTDANEEPDAPSQTMSKPADAEQNDCHEEDDLEALAAPTHPVGVPRSAAELFDETQEDLNIIRERINELKTISKAKVKEFIVLSFEITRNQEKAINQFDAGGKRAEKREAWKKTADQIKRCLKRLNDNLDSMKKSLVEKEFHHGVSLDLSAHELRKLAELKEVIDAKAAALEETTSTLQRWTDDIENLEIIATELIKIKKLLEKKNDASKPEVRDQESGNN